MQTDKGDLIMQKYFNGTTMIFSFIGAGVSTLLGGYDALAQLLVYLMVVDFVTGLIGAFVLRKYDSRIQFIGIVKKVFMLITVSVAVKIEATTGLPLLRELIICVFISNEGFSFVENVGKFIELPEQLSDFFVQIRKPKGEKEND